MRRDTRKDGDVFELWRWKFLVMRTVGTSKHGRKGNYVRMDLLLKQVRKKRDIFQSSDVGWEWLAISGGLLGEES